MNPLISGFSKTQISVKRRGAVAAILPYLQRNLGSHNRYRHFETRFAANVGIQHQNSKATPTIPPRHICEIRNLSFKSGAKSAAPSGSDIFKQLKNEIANDEELAEKTTEEESAQKTRKVASSSDVEQKKRPAYMDNQATTPVDPRVLDKMLPLFIDIFGNPHSRSHAYGWEAEDLVEEARRNVADIIHASAKEIIFTSGATESNNMAIKGAAEFYGSQNKKKRHIITTQIEHKCVLASCRHLENLGWDVTYLPVDTEGLICLKSFEAAIRPGETLLASVMFVNNEIGVIQPLKEIGQICRKHNVIFHSDAAQGVGKLPINVDELNIDLLSISGHKIYGPKGIGALYVRGKPRIRLSPMISGGGQERGFRSGTLPAPIIVGFGEACRIAVLEMENDQKHISFLADRLYHGITSRLPEVDLNGHKLKRYHGNLNLSFAYVEGESLLMSLPSLAISSGSACTSASLEPSYVLRALGVDEELAHTSLRFGIGRFTTVAEIDQIVEEVVDHVQRLRELSPLYELSKESAGGKSSSFVWT